MISVRLTTEMENKLNQLSKDQNISRSEVIKQALVLYFNDYENKKTPFELGEDLFGKYGSGKGNLSKEYKTILKGKLREKHSH